MLLAYENEAIFAQQSGQDIQIVVPAADDPDRDTRSPPRSSAPSAAKAFLEYMYTPAAQTIFAENGYRPVVSSAESAFTTTFPNAQTPSSSPSPTSVAGTT